MKWLQMKAYIIVIIHVYIAFFIVSIVCIYFPLMRILVEYFQLALVVTGSIFSTFNPVILKNILNKIETEDTDPEQRNDEIPPPSPDSSELSDDENASLRTL